MYYSNFRGKLKAFDCHSYFRRPLYRKNLLLVPLRFFR
jgi:hypothetical protein